MQFIDEKLTWSKLRLLAQLPFVGPVTFAAIVAIPTLTRMNELLVDGINPQRDPTAVAAPAKPDSAKAEADQSCSAKEEDSATKGGFSTDGNYAGPLAPTCRMKAYFWLAILFFVATMLFRFAAPEEIAKHRDAFELSERWAASTKWSAFKKLAFCASGRRALYLATTDHSLAVDESIAVADLDDAFQFGARLHVALSSMTPENRVEFWNKHLAPPTGQGYRETAKARMSSVESAMRETGCSIGSPVEFKNESVLRQYSMEFHFHGSTDRADVQLWFHGPSNQGLKRYTLYAVKGLKQDFAEWVWRHADTDRRNWRIATAVFTLAGSLLGTGLLIDNIYLVLSH